MTGCVPESYYLHLLQVWFDSDENMVECDGCEYWIHDTCDDAAKRALHVAATKDEEVCIQP